MQIAKKEHPNKGRKFGRPFQPGHRPAQHGKGSKKVSLTGIIRSELERIPTMAEDGFDGKGKTNAYWIAHNLVNEARDGDKASMKDVLDRIEGRPAQVLSGPGGGPIETRQVISFGKADLAPALTALVECGAIQIGQVSKN